MYEFLNEINHAKNVQDAWLMGAKFFKQFGVDWAIYAYAEKPETPDEAVELAPPLFTYPHAWMEHYIRENYASVDFTARHCVEHLTPIRMGIDLAPPNLPTPMRQVVEEGLDGYGHRSGIVFPTRWSGYRGVGGIGLASSLPGAEFVKILAEHEHLLYAAAQALHAQLRLLETRDRGAAIRLRPREREILLLVALGYTNREIADKLGTAENTVKSYLADVSRLLGAANRTHAVVLAAWRGLIEL